MNIRTLFSQRRNIDRTIEKVIDYYARDEERLAQEVSEYEITDNIEACFRKFLEVYDEGVRGGRVTEVGVWVSGFYGSGKSSFTKYLGAALDPSVVVNGRPFLDLLCERFPRKEIQAILRTLAAKHPTAAVFLDLGAEQLAENAAVPVANVLYWKVLQWAGYSKEKKIARLEFTLERRGKYDAFKAEYKRRYQTEWEEIHNDPLIGVNRAAEIIPAVMPEDFPTPESFRTLRFEEAGSIRDLAAEIIELCRRRTSKENILFLVDEAGQYVAPRAELILNMDGLARNLKELGKGKVWIIATGQQTLAEIVEKSAHNSEELNKLRDRFPISIHLDASDIREITYRRLLEKSEEGRAVLSELFRRQGQALILHTRLTGTAFFKGDPDADTFVRLYPFLPQHFDLLLELIRTLARSTGGIGLRSAIRIIQDVLVDKSRVLGPHGQKLADREIGTLACVDDFYNTLRADIAKVLPHVTAGVDKVARIFPDSPFVLRVAKAVAALQPIDNFPRSAENIAALLYDRIGSPSIITDVQEALRRLTTEKETGLIEDPQSGGYMFLSDAVKPIRDKRNGYIPTSGELTREMIDILRNGTTNHPFFREQPSAKIGGTKDVKASVKLGRQAVVGGDEEIVLMVEMVEPSAFDDKRGELSVSTNSVELKNTVVLLAKKSRVVEDLLPEIVKSERILGEVPEYGADRDVAQFLRSERRAAERNREQAASVLENTLMEGVFIFRGVPVPVREIGATLEAALRTMLTKAAEKVFDQYYLAPIRPATDLAAKFLAVDRLDRITNDLDPLHLVVRNQGAPRIDINAPVLAEVLRVFQAQAADSGANRLQGLHIQNFFSGPPYGWTKDTVRYLFAALLRAGKIELHTAGADGPVKTAGPVAVEAVKNTVAFNKIGVSPRDVELPPEALDRAARRLQVLFGDDVLPLEDHISRAVRHHLPDVQEKLGSLPDRLRLLELQGVERARSLQSDITELLKGDAGGAAAMLGGVECRIPEEINWARSVYDALEGGAEEDVKKARKVLISLSELENLIPGTVSELLPSSEREIVEEILQSDRFYERLPEMRSIIRGLTDRTFERYRIERAAYMTALEAAQNELESDPGWARLLEEDRAEIVEKLKCSLPEDPGEEPLRMLQMLMFRKRTLSALIEELDGVIRSRQLVEYSRPKDGGDQAAEGNADEEIITPDTLIDAVEIAITDEQDIDMLLASVRKKLEELLGMKKKIRITKKVPKIKVG